MLVANWPWTMVVIRPINEVLMATPLDAAGTQSRLLILKWNRLHTGRIILGFLAVIAFLYALRTT